MYDYLTKVSSVLRSGANVSDFADSMSQTQYVSKKWFVDILARHNYTPNPTILILGGWYGSYLVPMLNDALNPKKIHFNDKNRNCIEVASILHRGSNIDFHCFDATTDVFDKRVDIIVNTSCEHMGSYDAMLSNHEKCLYALQTCDNKNDPGHINISSSTEEFLKKLNLNHVIFAGRRDLGHKNRFTVLGQK